MSHSRMHCNVFTMLNSAQLKHRGFSWEEHQMISRVLFIGHFFVSHSHGPAFSLSLLVSMVTIVTRCSSLYACCHV